MKLETIDIDKTIESTRKLLDEDPNVSPALKSSMELLMVLITILLNRLGLNSSNSSKPPSSDPNRNKKKPGTKKTCGQKGHNGTTLKKITNPDVIKEIPVDKSNLPKGEYKISNFHAVTYEALFKVFYGF